MIKSGGDELKLEIKKVIRNCYIGTSLRQKLLTFILSLIIVTCFISIYSNINARRVIRKYDEMFQKIIYVNEVSNNIAKSHYLLRQYLIYEEQEGKLQFIILNESIKKELLVIRDVLNHEESMLKFVNIQNMFNNYIIEATKAYQKWEYNDSTFIINYTEAAEINDFIIDKLTELMDNELNYNQMMYVTLRQRANVFQNALLALVILLLVISIAFTWGFLNDIINPIQKLINQTSRISQGELEMKDIQIESYDEIGHLTISFNHMIHNIQKLIKEIKDQARLESLLKETELKALQAQVNPHFLFNTLSGITESALVEGADQTLNMVEEISEMLRYSLTSFHKKVTLEEEIQLVKRYVYLQTQRFGERIRFQVDLPETIPEIYIPCMTIQPLVENSIIHGLERKIEGGTIKISLTQEEEDIVYIHIIDDGVGIDMEALGNIFDENKEQNHVGHTTGIGVNNVNERLRLYFGQDSLLKINSEVDKGTCVTIMLPYLGSNGEARSSV